MKSNILYDTFQNILPPTINLCHPSAQTAATNSEEDEEFDLDYVPHIGRSPTTPIEHALCNSFGFGGTNASLCISRYRA
jgi:3-oxoacyl-[acyl-carrier-protein] synthase II